MKQAAFEEHHRQRWGEFERQLVQLDAVTRLWERRRGPTASKKALVNDRSPDFPALYRAICRDLSLARARRYTPALQDRLNALVLAGHRHLYWRETEFISSFVRFIGHGFPARVRAEKRFVAAAAALFVIPGLAYFALVMFYPDLIYSMFSPDQIREYESMYDPSAIRVGTNREAGSDIQMFGFYIANNIGVGFQTFASGFVFGLGSAFYLLANGLILGGLSAHVLHLGYSITFFPFVIGHGSVELTAIVIAGAAGLKLGFSLIAPGSQSRVQALGLAAKQALELVYGVIAMLVMAALLEAFWSSKGALSPELKVGVGAVLWALVFLYFFVLGRSSADAEAKL